MRYTELPVFSQQNEQVNVRQLRDGRTQQAVFESLDGTRLHLRMPESPGTFQAGELVEIHTARTLYLGQIISRHGELVLIVVEHSLDREALAAIHEVWHRPEGA